jgi:hypothetical protein
MTARLDASLHLPRAALPAAAVAALKRLATFANPVFYEKQRLRFPTYDTPRFIFTGELHLDRLVLPRGVVDEAVGIVESAGGTVALHDARADAPRVRWTFHGELRAEQERAVREMMKYDYGVLSAPPGAGIARFAALHLARRCSSSASLRGGRFSVRLGLESAWRGPPLM